MSSELGSSSTATTTSTGIAVKQNKAVAANSQDVSNSTASISISSDANSAQPGDEIPSSQVYSTETYPTNERQSVNNTVPSPVKTVSSPTADPDSIPYLQSYIEGDTYTLKGYSTTGDEDDVQYSTNFYLPAAPLETFTFDDSSQTVSNLENTDSASTMVPQSYTFMDNGDLIIQYADHTDGYHGVLAKYTKKALTMIEDDPGAFEFATYYAERMYNWQYASEMAASTYYNKDAATLNLKQKATEYVSEYAELLASGDISFSNAMDTGHGGALTHAIDPVTGEDSIYMIENDVATDTQSIADGNLGSYYLKEFSSNDLSTPIRTWSLIIWILVV